MLKRRGVKHVVLNAKYHAQEAEIVAQAGRKDGITIATNMAGRGTDILLGGNAEFMARQQSLAEEAAERLSKEQARFVDDDEFVYFFHLDSFYRVPRPDWDRIFSHFTQQWDDDHKEVVRLGGLHIIATERHEARRIDNQLRGRAGRQGDPGSSRFYLSLEDDLMRIFGSDRIAGLMQRLGMEEGVPIEHGMVTRAIERAQKQVEAQNFSVRKHLLEYDDVMNKQRENIYTLRRSLLEDKIRLDEDERTADAHGYLMALAGDVLDDIVERFVGAAMDVEEWDVPGLQQEIIRVYGFEADELGGITFETLNTVEIREALWARIEKAHADKETLLGPEFMRRVERDIMLQIVDQQWKDHLYSLDHLKEGIGLRGYGQRDPLVEYKRESFALFQDMKARIEDDIVRHLWHLRAAPSDDGAAPAPVRRPAPRRGPPLMLNDPSAMPSMFGGGAPAAVAERANPFAPRPARVGGDDATVKTQRRDEPKVGRNDPCPCGSGKKYKKCHGVVA
ncbi:MAG: SEC-C domain-containing protein [Vicinamibacteria bacterium]|nr:SEC-C domain-containing protein [Vicinamibacteria bacterium]